MLEPIVVVPYEASWKLRFEELSAQLSEALGPNVRRIEHVGSTAIPGLQAKPIVDVDLVISDSTDIEQVKRLLSDLGYRHVGNQGVPGREAFEHLRQAARDQDHHLYVCRESADELHRHITFRDYLLDHPDVANEYGQLKSQLASEFRDDREAYTQEKSQFVNWVLAQARIESK